MKYRFAAVVLLLVTGSTLRADSLFSDTSFFSTLYGDRTAYKVGDVLHILVTESATATQSASRTHNKQSDATVGPGVGWLDFIPLLGYGGKSSYTAGSTANRSGSISARLSVTVKEVLSGGNLLVEGRRYVKINKDIQEIVFRGKVRCRDIRSDDTVYSYQVAGLEIEYEGSDPAKPHNNVGIISRILNFLF